MDIEIKETGYDAPVVNTGQAGIELFSRYGSGLFQCYPGKGFSFWNNQYLFSSDTVLHARANTPVLELHITRSGAWKGQWEGKSELDLHPREFNLTYTPHVMTSGIFKKKTAYRSCDIHFEFSYLEALAGEFPALDKLLSSVIKGEAASLAPRNHYCTHEMIKATDDIISNPFGTRVQPYILETKVKQILIAALEKVTDDIEKPVTVLRNCEKESLHHVRTLIENSTDEPLTHSELSRLSGLNEWMLKRGFKMLFGQSPYQYHVQLKMERARDLLQSTNEPIDFIAYSLGYSQASSFGAEFKKAVGMTPAAFRKSAMR